MINISSFARRSAVLLLLAAISSAQAQWTSSNLHPDLSHLNLAGATSSAALGTAAGSQVGEVELGGTFLACLWNGTAASWVNLSPSGSESSSARGTSGSVQGGYAVFSGEIHAGIWAGDAASFVDLHPDGADSSSIAATDGTQHAGNVVMSGIQGASVWTGSSGTWTNLNPDGCLFSDAFGVGDGQQVGWAFVDDLYKASLWTGDAASRVDLHPAGADYSIALAAKGGFQVGHVTIAGVQKATLWEGTAESAVDLHPATADFSAATALDRTHQVGYAFVGGVSHASLWQGSAASWVDLHASTPAGFTESTATGVYHTPTSTVVSGSGLNSLTGRTEALLWVGPPLSISWSGFLQPINSDGSSIFKLGRVIPVSFRLTGSDAGNTTLVARLYVARVTNGEVGTDVEIEEFHNEDSGGVFQYVGQHYRYKLGTSWMSPGTWRLRVDLGDGVEHAVLITLRR